MSGTTTQTVGGLIALTLKMAQVIGDGQTAQASDTNDALSLLNQMTAMWNADRWLTLALQDISYVSTGAESYTVGVGSSFNVSRPDRLEAAYMRQLNGSGLAVDFPLQIISSYEDYSRLALKSMQSFSRSVFYDAAYPVANVYFWPIPPASTYELHILVKELLPQYSSLTTVIGLPPVYLDAIMYNLAARLRMMYGFPPDAGIVAMAKTSLNTIRNSNAQIPSLRISSTVMGSNAGYGWYNPLSDNN